METSSISKGIFVLKRGGKKKRTGHRSLKNRAILHPCANSHWYQAYKATWDSIQEKLKALYDSIFLKLQKDVSTYLNAEMKNYQTCSSVFEIPTATILTGINMPDHMMMYATLERELEQSVSPHVVLLSSRNCLKVRSLVGHILKQCRKKASTKADESIEDLEGEMADEETYSRVVRCTFSVLEDWYKDQYRDTNVEPQPLVIVLTDFEGFNPTVLADFIYVASEYRATVPLVLVFGVATTETTAHSFLPHRVMSRLKMKAFSTQESKPLLDKLIEEIILSPECHFKIGGKVFRMLTDNFLFYDFSIASFLQKFKFCMLEHFSHVGMRVGKSSSTEVQAWIESLSAAELEQIRRVPSFRYYVESKMRDERVKLLTDDEFLKIALSEIHLHFENSYEIFMVGLNCLKELTQDLPDSAVGNTLGDMYFRAVSTPIWESKEKEYQTCQNYWKNMSKIGLATHLSNLRVILNGPHPKLRYWRQEIRNLERKLQDCGNLENVIASPSKKQKVDETTTFVIRGREQLRQHLRDNATSKTTLNAYEQLRDQILSRLHEMLCGQRDDKGDIEMSGLLSPPGQLPLHEIMLFDNLETAKKQLIGGIRDNVNAVLTNPQKHLRCACCVMSSVNDVISALPDVCIAYKLHLECGKHINLFDWLQSFNAVLNPHKEGDEDADEIDKEMQCRFTQAVAELQFLGFVKSTTRKMDHVMRLTYGYSS